ncbi:putative acetyltransferase [Actinoplanes octamycinicus]|uniref:Putative acetyltransferase n=1 Tax=Actinoplanes octamycinicus TaxID=135948 RepID=A0A7W7H5G8_9ACTN|nr:GNAT family N-acetyltransferase [Actinoplanes octamycinicus]MBB4744358.1 putative acetyltransferase [Actinoplanes octamycinicus]GIE56681.1 acetyltransferase [Actinoplanes octamycinicus]
MPELIIPTARLRDSWLESRDEWGRGVHQDGAGLRPGTEVDTPEQFAAWVDGLVAAADRDVPAPEGWVHCTFRWIVEDDRYLGAIALRHELNDFLLRAGGHIGYGVRPSARRRGLASWALGEMLVEAGKLGLDRVLITCNVANEASARTIEGRGGVLEDVRETELGPLKRYWISL